MIAALLLIGVIVVAVGLRALPRPAAEMLVDYLYRAAMRSAARAVAVDRAVVTYRREMASMKAAHTPMYAEAANG
jgi:hypothetical protein